ncbi:hypothetical protein JTE90_015480 [Oedothorax gibbosus]|uniref:Uncharacterized protein n=1 Tax=Oedothorax gibbosus TaxID=931172 RepID=A0AAV6TPP1_9ARAC|nr:hypothetical protein JTE90_015480 [Oedothorax gibbosus]
MKKPIVLNYLTGEGLVIEPTVCDGIYEAKFCIKLLGCMKAQLEREDFVLQEITEIPVNMCAALVMKGSTILVFTHALVMAAMVLVQI